MRRKIIPKHPAKRVGKHAKKETSWGHVANWYHEHVTESDDTYHEKVIKPNLLRVLGDVKDKHLLDVAWGRGFFAGPPGRGGRARYRCRHRHRTHRYRKEAGASDY